MKSLTLILGGIVIGTILGSQGAIKALTSGWDVSSQHGNRVSYYWYDKQGRSKYKIVIWNRRK